MQSSSLPLAGRHIVLTRPAGQAQALAALISERGGCPILFPLLEILDVHDRNALNAIIDRLDTYDLAIFISPNAAVKGYEAIRARRSFPPMLEVAAVGRGSADALEALGVRPVIVPGDGADSESLLRVPALERIAGKRIVIFRGVGGRELLRDTLVARGAAVDYAECYRRVRPAADLTSLMRSWGKGEIDAFVVTSSEALRNLHELVGERGRELLATTPVFASHERIAAKAKDLGLKQVFVTWPGDGGIAASLAEHFGTR